MLDKLLLEVQQDGVEIYGQNAELAKDLFEKMYQVAKSNKKLMPEIKPQAPKENINGLSPDDLTMYEQPYKSAKSKFDHCDVYFTKDKNPMNYSKLIS